MAEPRPQLDYAAAPPMYRRRAVRCAAVVAGLLVFVVILGYFFLEPATNHVRLLIAQRRVAAIAYPPTQVAWEEDPVRIANWTGGAPSGPGWETFSDADVRVRGGGGRVRAAYLVPPASRELFEIPGAPRVGVSAVYVGVRDAGAGPRLVAVATEGRPYHHMLSPGRSLSMSDFRVTTVRPATLITGLSYYSINWSDDDTLGQIPAGQLRLYWGQPDPADPAHFTIRYESPAAAGTIDGWLMPDDSVQLTLIPAPTTAPSR